MVTRVTPGIRHQLFTTIRTDSPCTAGDLDSWTWSSVTALCRSLDWTVVHQQAGVEDASVTITSVVTDRSPDPIVIRTFWRYACTLVDIPAIEGPDEGTTAAVLEFECTDSPDFVVWAGATHPVAGHLISVDELMWFENGRRHWERADLGATLEDLD